MTRFRSASLNNAITSEIRKGIGYAHGTFGELLQGTLHGANNQFLVTLPISRFSKATFLPDPHSNELVIEPAHKIKSLDLLKRLIAHFNVDIGGRLIIESELPEGKGMASSSADMVATVRALENSFRRLISIDMLLSMLRAIEPTDGVMFPDFVSFFHRRVDLCRRFGFPSSRIKILAVDEGGQVDTVAFNQRSHEFDDDERNEYASLLEKVETAIAQNDLTTMGKIATRSAILHQDRHPKRHLEKLLQISRDTGALGVAVAHSGSCAGLLYPEGNPAPIEKARRMLRRVTDNIFTVSSLNSDYLKSAETHFDKAVSIG